MNDKNKIKSEIERLLNKEWKWQSSIEGKYRCETYRELLEFIDSLPKESASEDLEKAAMKYAVEVKGFPGIANETDKKVLKAFKAGADWQKQQMMKDAVVGHVSTMYNDMLRANTRLMDKNIQEKLGIEFGDVVKLIIVKKD